MAFFTLIQHPDPQRRARFVARSRALAGTCAPLELQAWDCGEAAGVAGAPCRSLLDVQQTGEAVTLRLGLATARDPSGPTTTASLAAWLRGSDRSAAAYPGGYFLACTWTAPDGLRLAVDRWGLYPLYYTELPDGALLAASSPEFLAADAAWASETDVPGLCGLLLTNGLLHNRTLFRNAARLPAGSILHRTPARALTFSAPPPPPLCADWEELDREPAVERLGPLWQTVLRRLAPAEPAALLLSGGLDSRMIAGGLQRAGLPVSALTFGARLDYEVRAARGVARVLRQPWVLAPDASPAALCADLAHNARWSGLSGGNSTGGGWCLFPPELDACRHVWIGVAVDDFLGGKGSNFLRTVGPEEDTARFLKRLCSWGLPAETLARLLRDPAWRALPDALIDEAVQTFRARELPRKAATVASKLDTRIRYHLGGLLWQLSFRAWPLLPGFEPEIVEAGFNLRAEAVGERTLQHAFLLRYHAELNRVPIDSNTHTFRSLQDGSKPLWRDRWPWLQRGPGERRRYYRVYDPNRPAWRRVRHAAEPHRHRLADLFDLPAVEAIWPAASARWAAEVPFGPLAAGRNLLALAWRRGMD